MKYICSLALFLFTFASAQDDMQPIGDFAIDRTEVTIGQFREFANATGTVTKAEQAGGGEVFEAGWVQKPGWTWQTPFGIAADDNEPVVHVTFDEAQGFCAWAGKRLPTDGEWLAAAYTESRVEATAPFVTGQTYMYPTGDSPEGANCLNDCGEITALDYSSVLTQGIGPALVGTTPEGVNGLYDMGANVWEWVDHADGEQRRTRGGSWWYGAAQMQADHIQSKPPQTAVVYIGFRCARDVE